MNVQDCETIEPALSAFADDEIFGRDREAVVRHLAGCAACRRTFNHYRAFGSALRDRAAELTPHDLSAITWPPAATPARPVPSRALTPRRRLLYDVARWLDPWPVLAGSAVLVALLIGVLLLQPTPRVANLAEIERLDAEGPVMVIPGSGGRMTIIWVFDTSDWPTGSAPAET
jgi:anti-sigma factor RsiW